MSEDSVDRGYLNATGDLHEVLDKLNIGMVALVATLCRSGVMEKEDYDRQHARVQQIYDQRKAATYDAIHDGMRNSKNDDARMFALGIDLRRMLSEEHEIECQITMDNHEHRYRMFIADKDLERAKEIVGDNWQGYPMSYAKPEEIMGLMGEMNFGPPASVDVNAILNGDE